MYICLAVVTVVGITLGITAVLAGDLLLGIYSSDAQVLRYGMLRLEIICGTYFLCGIMDCMVGSLRGLGYSVIPMFVSLTGACGFRVLWVFTVLRHTVPWTCFICPIRCPGPSRPLPI
jgi:Na+-driven multidrug efflux pump